ncbi:hypothetical protein LNTAR_01120 [Lentisphaera araneosa HTCC2155]|uniref:PpiC domain-containing protein n=1 Tax=Lentisphaera araneosa HTCC2155 TaxID=313628 RepID=A6DKR1_9BACT|nr:hypothetical protein [Lentisphaera araneosa]EDM27959.1 hypothetical protein LNTAR_01120 [Lentisphaera araneosa HTCC2155]
MTKLSKFLFLSFLCVIKLSLTSQVKKVTLEELNTSLLPQVCIQYDDIQYDKNQSLQIIKQYLAYYVGAPSDAQTVKSFIRNSLEQYFSFKALYELSRNAGCAADMDEARKFYDAYSNRLSLSKLIEELSVLNLSKEEIIRIIYEKQSVQNYRKKLFKNYLIGEAEAMLYYHENKNTFTQAAGLKFNSYKIENALTSSDVQSINRLLAQGLSFEKILQQKGISFTPLPEQFISETKLHESDFAVMRGDAQIHQIYMINSPIGPLLCKPTSKVDAKLLAFEKVKEKIINSLKSHQVNKQLKIEIKQHLELKGFKNFIQP